jgi:hypothetical protein
VIQGHRGKIDQNTQFYEGDSQLMWPNGKHNTYPSTAIDFGPYVPGQNVLYDRNQTLYFGGIVVATADFLYHAGKMRYRIRWGRNWKGDNNMKGNRFNDSIHFELVGVDSSEIKIFK